MSQDLALGLAAVPQTSLGVMHWAVAICGQIFDHTRVATHLLHPNREMKVIKFVASGWFMAYDVNNYVNISKIVFLKDFMRSLLTIEPIRYILL